MANHPHTNVTPATAEYDSPWKEVLERYFEPFMAFFFPQAHQDIDWSRPPEFLDGELRKIMRGAKTGRRYVDKLVRVWRLSGREAWVLVHIEVQAQASRRFPRRMYVYNYRLYDAYGRTVVSLAVLADERPRWRPERYTRELWGCEASLRFPVVKLLDYEARWPELEQSDSPFAVLVMAHLRSLATKDNPAERLKWKLWIIRRLYDRGYSRDDVQALLRFVDWVLALPEALEADFERSLLVLEKEKKMPYVTSIERRGRQRGSISSTRDAIVAVLDVRFDEVPESIREAITSITELPTLTELHRRAVNVPSLAEFEAEAARAAGRGQ